MGVNVESDFGRNPFIHTFATEKNEQNKYNNKKIKRYEKDFISNCNFADHSWQYDGADDNGKGRINR
jgi:hypothetical protein